MTIKAQIERLNELDKLRTQGDWELHPHQVYKLKNTWAIGTKVIDICERHHATANIHDGEFIASAPELLALVNKLMGIVERQGLSLEYYADASNYSYEQKIDGKNYIICEDGTDSLAIETLAATTLEIGE